ncbi:MAG: hypothetical protein U0V54_08710 [Saprospiraceae bacterium]|nr:hypothetical protein [Bacteroidia bacterium]
MSFKYKILEYYRVNKALEIKKKAEKGKQLKKNENYIYLQRIMKLFREHIVFRYVWIMLAFHIFNFSVDMPDPQPESVPEDLTYNDIESVVEIILEQVLDIKNAIEEKDDVDLDFDKIISLKKVIDFFYHIPTIKKGYYYKSIFVCSNTFYEETYSKQFHPELTPPPPKV